MNRQKTQEIFDKIARRQKSRKPNYYHRLLENFYRFNIPEGSRVLEIGCGQGYLLAAVRPAYGVGLDLSPEMINNARQKYPTFKFLVGDAQDLSAIQEKFDYVIISDLFGYLEDVQTALEAVRKICAGTRARIIINYYSFLWEQPLKVAELLHLKTKTGLQNWLSMSDIENLLDLAGLNLVKKGLFSLFPVYIPLVSYLFNRYLAPLPLLNQLCLVNYCICRVKNDKSKDLSVSIVIPARNEAGNIELAITRMPRFGSKQELIFIEGNSTDNTWMEIQRVAEKYKSNWQIKMARQKGRGKGDAVRLGFDLAEGEVLMILDADLTMPPEELPKFYNALKSDLGEFINGCRLVYPMEKEAMRFLNLLGNKFFSMAFTWVLGQHFKDTLCGTKVLHRENYRQIQANRGYFGDFDPFGDFDLIFGASKQNLKIVEIPIHYKDRTYGTTNISRFKHGWLLLKMVLFSLKKIKFIY